ncbi:MAG TPA: AraC family transcriptional regulator [Byssovorax sp.]
MRDAEVCIKAARACLLAGAAKGLDAAAIARSHGLDVAVLTDPTARVPHRVVAALWTEVPTLAGDDAFGLHAAEAVHAVGLDALDYALMHASTLREAIARLGRYVRLLHDAATITLEVDARAGVARYAQRFTCSPPAPRHFVEFVFAMWALRVGRGIGERPQLRRVEFEHAGPSDDAEHRRVFGVSPRFGARENAITFDASLLDRAATTSDPVLVAVLERHAQELLDRLPPRGDALDDVRAAISADLDGGAPALAAVARRLATSGRTLQRRIRAEGTTFSALVDDARRALVLGRVRDADATLSDLAFLAGFADTTTFHRAFRRWTGRTPSQYRTVDDRAPT